LFNLEFVSFNMLVRTMKTLNRSLIQQLAQSLSSWEQQCNFRPV